MISLRNPGTILNTAVMYSFSALADRISVIEEAAVSPYSGAHPRFGEIAPTLHQKGFPSAPYDTIKFITRVLYHLDIIGDQEVDDILKSSGFAGKKQALLKTLHTYAEDIKLRAEDISAKIDEELPRYINAALNTRGGLTARGELTGRKEKYDANALALQMAKQAKELEQSTKNLDAATVANMFAGDLGNTAEHMLVLATVDKVFEDIRRYQGDEGVDIDDAALDQVEEYIADNVKSIKQLRQFIKQIVREPGYDKIAAYLSAAIDPAKQSINTLKTAPFEDFGMHNSPGKASNTNVYQGDITFGSDDNADVEEFPANDSDLEDTANISWDELEHPIDKKPYEAETDTDDADELSLDAETDTDYQEVPVDVPKTTPKPPPTEKPTASPRKRTPYLGEIQFGEDEEGVNNQQAVEASASIGEFAEFLKSNPNCTVTIDTDVDTVELTIKGGNIVSVASLHNDHTYSPGLINSHIERWFNSPSVTIGRIITAAGQTMHRESYTASYMPKTSGAKYTKPTYIATRDRFKPKTMWQM